MIGCRMYELIRYQNDLTRYYSAANSFTMSMSEIRYTRKFLSFNSKIAQPDTYCLMAIIFDVLLLFALMFIVGILGLYQLYYVACNITTVIIPNYRLKALKIQKLRNLSGTVKFRLIAPIHTHLD